MTDREFDEWLNEIQAIMDRHTLDENELTEEQVRLYDEFMEDSKIVTP